MKQTIFLFFFALVYATGFAQPADSGMIIYPFLKPIQQTQFFRIGERTIPVKQFQYGESTGIVYINLHDNENSSVEAAMSLMEMEGGTLIKIENQDQRVIRFRFKGLNYAFDPNRIFSRAGIEQTLRENSHYNEQAAREIEKFAVSLLALIPDSTVCVIALHNNTNDAYSVKSYLPGHEREHDAQLVYQDRLQDEDDIVFTTDSLIYQSMAGLGYNAIWQDNKAVKKDGSLSVYFGESERRYVNLETQHGKVLQYRNMLEKLLQTISAIAKHSEIGNAVNRP